MLGLRTSNLEEIGALRLGCAACAIAALLAAAPLCRAETASSATPAARGSTDQAPQLAEVTVTATRSRRPEQKVAAPILVISMQRIQTDQINNYIDLARLAPSLDITSTFGIAQVFMRGLGIISANSGEESAVGVYIDGAYVARPEAQLTSLFDIQRVEVLEGPQGQLFGRNTIGGALNITTNGPTPTPEGYARVTFGNYNMMNTAEAIGGPITSNGELLGRVAVQTENHSGFGKNDVNGDPVDDDNRRMARVELEYVPSEAFNSLFSGEYYFQGDHEGALHFESVAYPQLQNIPALAYLGQGFQATNPRDANSSITDPKLDVDGANFTDTTDWRLNDQIELTSILNYRHFQQDRLQDLLLSGALEPLGAGQGNGSTSEGRTIMSNQKSAEFQLKYNRSWIHGIVGAYYFYELQTSDGHVGLVPNTLLDPDVQATLNSIVANPTLETVNGVSVTPQPYARGAALFTCRLDPSGYVNPSAIAPDFFCDRINQQTSSFAGYTQWRVGLGQFVPALDPLSLKVGYRYTTELHDVGDISHTLVPIPGLPTGLLILTSAQPLAGVPDDTNSERFNDSSPEAGLTWQLTPHDLVYYTYSEGFKAGSALETGELNSQGTVLISLPEKIWNNEFGIKTMWFHNRLLVNAAGFFYRLSNLQVQEVLKSPTGFSFILSNGAQTAAHGAEIHFEALPTSQLTVGGTIAWLDSRFTQFLTQDPLNPVYIPAAPQYNPNAPEVNVAGNFTPNSPQWTGELHADYQIPGLTLPDEGTLTLGGDVHFQSTTYFSEFDRLIEGQGTYAVGDTRLTYQSGDGHWTAEAWVNNISDALIKDGSYPESGINAVGVTYLPPRTFGITLGYKL
ncbi:MAG: TonB-dependent receptor [Steroidobacteraceae bacterium]